MKAVRVLSDVSQLVKAMQGWKEDLQSYSDPPKGMFGRKTIIKSGGVTINSDELEIDVNAPFDDDVEANEAEIIIYNLAETTIQALKWGNTLSIEAGYKGDTGVIFEGKIAKVSTKPENVDKVTTIKAIAYIGGASEELKDKSYKAGTKASYILKDLLSYIDLPVAVFKVKRDWTYKDAVNIDGEIWSEIKKYAEVCGISVYVNNGKVYARHITEGDNINFTVNADTGLIGSPEEFEEEITAEDYTDVVKGKMILQHRMTTAAIINLESQGVKGQFRVRSGKHIINESESVTEFEVV